MSLIISSSGGLSSAELLTGNLVKSYKQSENVSKGIAILRSEKDEAVSLLTIQQGKPLIHHYSLRKETTVKRIVTPAKLEAISISPNQQWLAGGSKDGSLYVWNLWSGALKALHSEAHFQAVTDLTWSKDSSALVSAGADARVLVWRTLDLVSKVGASPVHTLSTHSLSVVSVVLGAGSFRECRLYTASLDATVCVFDVFSGRLLFTLSCDSPIHTLSVDPAERALYLGADNGIHMVPLYYESPGGSKLTAVGSADGSVISSNSIERVIQLDKNETKVTASVLSTDGSKLIVGCNDGSVSCWEVGSGQLVKKFRPSKGGICDLIYIPNEFAPAEAFDSLPQLQRNVEPLSDFLDFVPRPVNIVSSDPVWYVSDMKELGEIEDFQSIHNDMVPNQEESEHQNINKELEELKQRHDQLRKMYDQLWTSKSKS